MPALERVWSSSHLGLFCSFTRLFYTANPFFHLTLLCSELPRSFVLVGSHSGMVYLLGSSVIGLLREALHGLMLPNFIILVNEQEANLAEPLLSVMSAPRTLCGPEVFCHLHHPILRPAIHPRALSSSFPSLLLLPPTSSLKSVL